LASLRPARVENPAKRYLSLDRGLPRWRRQIAGCEWPCNSPTRTIMAIENLARCLQENTPSPTPNRSGAGSAPFRLRERRGVWATDAGRVALIGLWTLPSGRNYSRILSHKLQHRRRRWIFSTRGMSDYADFADWQNRAPIFMFFAPIRTTNGPWPHQLPRHAARRQV